jgi:hypothetical protein
MVPKVGSVFAYAGASSRSARCFVFLVVELALVAFRSLV